MTLTCLSFHTSGNTRVISQSALDHFRTSLSSHVKDPYSVLLKRNKLPMSLLEHEGKGLEGKVRRAFPLEAIFDQSADFLYPLLAQRPHIVETEPFSNTFGSKAQRKRPHLEVGSFEELASAPLKDDIALDDGEEVSTEGAFRLPAQVLCPMS